MKEILQRNRDVLLVLLGVVAQGIWALLSDGNRWVWIGLGVIVGAAVLLVTFRLGERREREKHRSANAQAEPSLPAQALGIICDLHRVGSGQIVKIYNWGNVLYIDKVGYGREIKQESEAIVALVRSLAEQRILQTQFVATGNESVTLLNKGIEIAERQMLERMAEAVEAELRQISAEVVRELYKSGETGHIATLIGGTGAKGEFLSIGDRQFLKQDDLNYNHRVMLAVRRLHQQGIVHFDPRSASASLTDKGRLHQRSLELSPI